MKRNFKRLAFLVLLAVLATPIQSESRDGSKANRKHDKSEQADAVRVKEKDDDGDGAHDGPYWFSRGYSLHQSNRYVEAIEAFSHSIGLGHRQATCMYNVACGYAMLNDKENALFWLDRALAGGFESPDLLKNDSDLDPLRSDPRFKEIIRKVSLMKDEGKASKVKDKEDKNRDRLDEAIINFEQLRASSSKDGDQWYKVGSRLLGLRDFDRAITALEQAVDHLGYRGASAMYNLACTYALKGDSERGLKWLDRSVNAGFDDSDKFRDDPDIASLRDDPRFKQIEKLSRDLSLSGIDGDDWAASVKHFESFLREQPASGRGWFDLGFALHASGDHAKAIPAFERAIQNGYRQPTSMYNIACANAMMGNRDAAFEWLDKSVGAGFDIASYIMGDEDLASLRSDPRFKRFVEMTDEQHKNKHKDK